MPINQGRMNMFLLFLTLMYSCSSSVKLSGDYSSSQNPSSFILNPDSTFNYRYKFEFAYEYSCGTWKKAGGSKIVLTSNIQKKILPLKVQEVDTKGSDQGNYFSVNINLPDADRNYYHCMIFINDTLYGKRSCDSLVSVLITSPVRNIFFKIYSDARMPTRSLDTLTTDKFFPKTTTANSDKINILLNDSLFNYRIFYNEVLNVKRKALQYYNSRAGKWEYLSRRQ